MHVYTIDQVMLMHEVARENERREIVERAGSMRMAFGADKNEWKKFVQSMDPSPHAMKPRIDPKKKLNAIRRLLKNGR
jgi:hypothetical protein